MPDQETLIQPLPTNQQELLKLVIPKVLEISSENSTLQTRYLMEQGVPLAQTARAVKLLAQAGVLGPEEANQRTVNRLRAMQLLTIIGLDGTNVGNTTVHLSAQRECIL